MLVAVLLTLILGVSGCTTMRLSTIGSSDFEALPGKIYIDPDIKEFDQKKFFIVLRSAEEKIKKLMGEYSATPIIIVVGTNDNRDKYGLGPFTGKAYIAPWETYLVVSYEIDRNDLLAHEMMHAHISSTVGYWAYMTKLPAWFDEGLAMQLDNREKYIIDSDEFSSEEISRIMQIDSPADFRTSSKENDIQNYRLAKGAVRNILIELDAREINSRLKEMRAGRKFSYVIDGTL